jgi:hypothetical protein
LDQDQKTRLGGLFLIVGGAVLGYLSIWTPYKEAQTGAQTVALSQGGIALSILFPLLGVILAIGGQAVNEHFKAQIAGKKTKLGWVYIAIIGAVALGVYKYVEHRFALMGYTI